MPLWKILPFLTIFLFNPSLISKQFPLAFSQFLPLFLVVGFNVIQQFYSAYYLLFTTITLCTLALAYCNYFVIYACFHVRLEKDILFIY